MRSGSELRFLPLLRCLAFIFHLLNLRTQGRGPVFWASRSPRNNRQGRVPRRFRHPGNEAPQRPHGVQASKLRSTGQRVIDAAHSPHGHLGCPICPVTVILRKVASDQRLSCIRDLCFPRSTRQRLRAREPRSAAPADPGRGLQALLLRQCTLRPPACWHLVEQVVPATADGTGQRRCTGQDHTQQAHGAVRVHAAQCPPPGAGTVVVTSSLRFTPGGDGPRVQWGAQ